MVLRGSNSVSQVGAANLKFRCLSACHIRDYRMLVAARMAAMRWNEGTVWN